MRGRARFVGALVAIGAGGGAVFAQQGDGPVTGGPVLTFGISTTASATDNYDLSATDPESAELFDTRLSFGYATRRALDELRLDLSGVVRAIDPPTGGGDTLDDRRARLSYAREGADSALSLDASYSLSSVETLDPFDPDRVFDDDPVEETDLVQDEGDREQITTRFSFETGRDGPVGFAVRGSYRERTFDGVTSSTLFDERDFNVSGTASLALSPVTEARVILRYADYSADDAEQTERQTSSVNLGLTQALSKIDTLEATLGYQRIDEETVDQGAIVSDDETGLVGTLSLTRELRRGTIGAEVDLSESVNGTTTTFRVNREMALPRGALAFSLGVTSDVDDELRPVARVSLTQETRRGAFSASLERRVSTSSRSNELETTQISVSYNRAINSVSALSLSADFASLDQAGGPQVDEADRFNFRATYNRDLTRDWQLSSGYEYRRIDEGGGDTATSNRVFLTLNRTFAIRP